MGDFLRFVSEMSAKDLNHAENEIDTIFRVAGADIEFTRHFMNRVLDHGEEGRYEYDDNQYARETDVTPEELVKIFKTFWKEKGRVMALQLKKDPKSFEFVLKDIATAVNIPIAVSVVGNQRVVRLDCQTLIRNPNWRSSSLRGNQKIVTVRTR